MWSETQLQEKLTRIEALFAGATAKGERVAAGEARERILTRLHATQAASPPIEYHFTFNDPWGRKLFLALLRRYDFRPYRYHGQRHTTVMTKVSKRFVDETLWPEFQELSKTLGIYLEEVTERVITQVIHRDSSEAEEVIRPLLRAAEK